MISVKYLMIIFYFVQHSYESELISDIGVMGGKVERNWENGS